MTKKDQNRTASRGRTTSRLGFTRTGPISGPSAGRSQAVGTATSAPDVEGAGGALGACGAGAGSSVRDAGLPLVEGRGGSGSTCEMKTGISSSVGLTSTPPGAGGSAAGSPAGRLFGGGGSGKRDRRSSGFKSSVSKTPDRGGSSEGPEPSASEALGHS